MTAELSLRHLTSAIRAQDTAHFKFLLTPLHRNYYLRTIWSQIQDGTFYFHGFKRKTIRSFTAYRTQKLGDELLLRCLSDSLRRRYRIKQGDRSSIVQQVKHLIAESSPKYILRLDLASFYESVDMNSLLAKLKADGIVPYRTLLYITRFFETLSLQKIVGLPRGLSISAVLSEIYLREMDKTFHELENVYYYARYVDDLIFFSTTKTPN